MTSTRSLFRPSWRTTALLTAVLLLSHTTASLADDRTAVPAKRFNRAVEMAKQDHYREAILIWEDILDDLEKDHVPRAHRHLGLAYKNLQVFPEAWYHLKRYLSLLPVPEKTVESWVRDVEKELKPGHRQISFSCAPGALKLYPKGPGKGPSYPCPLTWWYKPGVHLVRAQDSRRRTKDIKVIVVPGSTAQKIEVRLEPPTQVKPTPKKPPKKTAPKRWPWIAIGGGAGLAIVGGLVHWWAFSKEEDIYRQHMFAPTAEEFNKGYGDGYDEQVTPRMISAVLLYGVGGAAIITGTLFLLLDKPGASNRKSSVSIIPTLSPGAGVLNWRWSF